MMKLFYSCFNQTDEVYKDHLEMLLMEDDNYRSTFGVTTIVRENERKIIQFMEDIYDKSGAFPSQKTVMDQFEEAQTFYAGHILTPSDVLGPDDLRSWIFKVVNERVRGYITVRVGEIQKLVGDNGITDELSDEWNRLMALSNSTAEQDVEINISGRDNYNNLKARPNGLLTGIKEVDNKIGGMNEGTVSTIAGFTSQFKTTWAMNIAYRNAYLFGYNIAYITLETPKDDMYWNYLSCHSYNYKGQGKKYNFIGHDRMRRTLMLPEEEDYIFDVIEKDLTSGVIKGNNGKEIPRGRVIFLDESDFITFSFAEIQRVLNKIDDKLIQNGGGGLDAVVVDYIQLCKYNGSSINYNETSQVNAYTSFFRRLSQNFKKEKNQNGEEVTKQITVLLLAQIRRDSWRKAANHNGVYDITCMSDSSELEKSSHRIFTTFTTEDMKLRGAAQVQILKNRTGQTMIQEPEEVYANGEAYVILDNSSNTIGSNPFAGADGQASITAMFANDNIDELKKLLGGDTPTDAIKTVDENGKKAEDVSVSDIVNGRSGDNYQTTANMEDLLGDTPKPAQEMVSEQKEPEIAMQPQQQTSSVPSLEELMSMN